MPKFAITCKGGVGKTTLAGLLARIYAADGYTVLAVDADPSASLASSLGFPLPLAAQITPIAEMKDLIEERTEAKPGSMGGFFKLNPYVDDIPDTYGALHNGVRLLVMGGVERGGSGCICPESALLKMLTTHLLLRRQEVLIMDMEAGVENMGRATAGAVDAMLIVVEPGRRSVDTARAIQRLAQDIHIPRLYAVGCKVRSDSDQRFLVESLPELEVIGSLPWSELALEADRRGVSVYDLDPQMVAAARAIKGRLEKGLEI